MSRWSSRFVTIFHRALVCCQTQSAVVGHIGRVASRIDALAVHVSYRAMERAGR